MSMKAPTEENGGLVSVWDVYYKNQALKRMALLTAEYILTGEGREELWDLLMKTLKHHPKEFGELLRNRANDEDIEVLRELKKASSRRRRDERAARNKTNQTYLDELRKKAEERNEDEDPEAG